MAKFKEIDPADVPDIRRKESSVKEIVEEFLETGSSLLEVDVEDTGRSAKDLRRLINSYAERNNKGVRALRRENRLFLAREE